MFHGRWWLVAVALLVAVAACQQSPTPAFHGGPRLSLEPSRLDLGQLPTATPVEVAFTLRNIGDSPLQIERAFTRVVEGCCPPQPQLKSRVIKPGGEERMSFRVIMSQDMVGPHRFEVVIVSNDAVAPRLTAEITAEFVPQ
jgi:hypothetical protein